MSNILSADNIAKHVSQVSSMLPSFVVEDHPKFVNFLKTYYRWSATEGPAAALNYLKVNNDIDMAMDSMLDGYSSLFAYNIPKNMKVDYRFFMKFLKSFYEIKGTEESYKILYRALFNEDVIVHYPVNNLFITSGAQWATDRSFKLKFDGDGYGLRGKSLKGAVNGFKCIVSDVVKSSNHWTIFFQNSTGDFVPDEKIEISGLDEYGYIIPVYEIESVTSGSNWFDNDVIQIESDLFVKVDKIHYGSIKSVTIVSGGAGYSVGDKITTVSEFSGTGFQATVSSVGLSGEIETIQLKRGGFGYVSNQVNFLIQGNGVSNGVGFEGDIVWNDDFMKIHRASILLNREKTTQGNETFSIGTGESITFKSGVYTTPRFWKQIKGATSTETARLHDSDYYQEYSYVLTSVANAHENEAAMKKILQIAGLKLFIEQSVSMTSHKGFTSLIDFQS